MDVVNERCCGLDIHKKSITAYAITPKGKEIQTFGTWSSSKMMLKTQLSHIDFLDQQIKILSEEVQQRMCNLL
jgi:hypothetical protein